MENLIPRKSASLIISKINPNPSSLYNYKLLLFKRSKNGSFPNVYAFPGGNYSDKYDNLEIPKDEFPLKNLINTAHRELLEECGLFFSQLKSDDWNILNEIKKDFLSKNKHWDEFNYLKSSLNKDFDEIYPFIRLITIPYLKYRYDTQFFFYQIKKNSAVNWKQFFNADMSFDSTFQTFDQINFDRKEFDEMIWLDPSEILYKFYTSKDFRLAPPQFLIINILSSFLDFRSLIAYLNTRKTKKFQVDPFTFPNMFYLTNTEKVSPFNTPKNYPYLTLSAGDWEYPIETIANNEKDEMLKKEIIKKSEILKGGKNEQKNRIYFEDLSKLFECKFETEIKLNSLNPFNFLKSYEEIQNFIKFKK